MSWFRLTVYNRDFNGIHILQYKNLFDSKIMSNFEDDD
jgi:hypothetical protein